jgi:hypothetical protein
MPKTCRRRRCRICRGWFRPNARQGDRQYACSKPECQLVRQVRNEEARLVRDPAYFRGRAAKRPRGTPAPRPRRETAAYEEVRDRVAHKAIRLQLATMPSVARKVAGHDVHKVITAQLAVMVGLIAELRRRDGHKVIDFDLVTLHDRGRRLLAGGGRDGEARPG